jgi:MFS family permease
VTGRRTPLYGWLTSEAVSLTGTRVSMIAVPWFVLTTTGSATQTGLVAFAELAPLVLLKALGGPIIDRIGARRVAVVCDLASLVVVGLVPLLHAAGQLTFPVLLALVAVAGALRGPGDAAKHALIPTIVDQAEVPMERVTGLASAVERTAGMAGAALAGGLVALIGASNALLVDAASFGLSALVLLVTTRSIAASAPEQPDDLPYLTRLRTGWDFLRREPVLMTLTLMIAATNLIDIAFSAVLVPVWVKESGGGAAVVGLVFAVKGGSSAIGALIASRWAERMPRFKVYVAAFLVAGAPKFVVLALGAPLGVVLAVFVVAGFASGFLNPILGAVFYERIPAGLVGRVSSLSTAICFALMPLGGLSAGLLVTSLGIAWALALFGAAYLVATMAPAFVRSFRGMDRRPVDPSERELVRAA